MNHTQEGHLLTSIILDVFKLNGLLVQEGDKLVKELGLSSARWKVLGALSSSDAAMTVSDIARKMGQSRQSVQRLVNELMNEALLASSDNPNNKKAKLYSLTDVGEEIFAQAMEEQSSWVNQIAQSFSQVELQNTSDLLRKLTQKLA
ncbi:MarR family winged helix-turn-helix transcriptional regulator [Pseudoalteromonas peptidolytica]|uniref:MarR family winged helix-turn-helix transcriptional regulator n=1 Tax=Pseudoalteromonas peptidolytica TaxID=61150 RepID=UPI00298E7384|nr:MarR family transcriptional regulator [Pseudoalteromonas peptidolytica]MDW7548438.1 MarR family transcriptional regulator [Pseudoalteromonas peptidolytica]